MADDDTTAGQTTSGQSSSGAAASGGDDTQKVIDDLRARQSGADKARDIAIRERDEALARLAALQSGKSGSSSSGGEGNGIDIEALKQSMREEFRAETEKAVAAERLNGLKRLYPKATAKFPNLTDEAQLAELEEVFGDRPKPIGNNPQGAGAGAGAKRIEDMSIAELRANADKELAALLKPQS